MTEEEKWEKEFEEWFPYGEEHRPFMKEAYLAGRRKGQEDLSMIEAERRRNWNWKKEGA